MKSDFGKNLLLMAIQELYSYLTDEEYSAITYIVGKAGKRKNKEFMAQTK